MRNTLFAACTACLLTLSACGGGGDTDSSAAVASGPTLSGVAATGGAMANAALSARCTGSSAVVSTTTSSAGVFTLQLNADQAPPCLVKVVSPAVTLYGFAALAGRVNVTTLTDLEVAHALASDPSSSFDVFDATVGAKIHAGLPGASAYVGELTIFVAGLPASSLGDAMTTVFVVGDAYDQVLDRIGTAMRAAGRTYAELRGAAASGDNVSALLGPGVTSVDSTAPSTPAGLTVLTRTSNTVTLSWNASTGGAGGVLHYQIYRDGLLVNGAAANATSMTDVDLPPSKTLSYSVTATSVAGTTSASSNIATTTTLDFASMKAKFSPYISFDPSTGKIMNQFFATPGLLAVSKSLMPYVQVVEHARIDSLLYGIRAATNGQYEIYLYTSGQATEAPIPPATLSGSTVGNRTIEIIDMTSGAVYGTVNAPVDSLMINVADGRGGYLSGEVL